MTEAEMEDSGFGSFPYVPLLKSQAGWYWYVGKKPESTHVSPASQGQGASEVEVSKEKTAI
eukprot:764683-Hanusia_phi.AAC.3